MINSTGVEEQEVKGLSHCSSVKHFHSFSIHTPSQVLCRRSQRVGDNEHITPKPGRDVLLVKVRFSLLPDGCSLLSLTKSEERRVKCDETRPACLRCTSSGRVCDGDYQVQPPYPSQQADIVSVVAGPSFDIHLHVSPESKRSFAFFIQRSSAQQAGFFGSAFWERLVLQAAYHEPIIRHAIVAIGSLQGLQECRTVVEDADKLFALEQYNHAIRGLLHPPPQSGERGVDVCLIACILFVCFEVRNTHPHM